MMTIFKIHRWNRLFLQEYFLLIMLTMMMQLRRLRLLSIGAYGMMIFSSTGFFSWVIYNGSENVFALQLKFRKAFFNFNDNNFLLLLSIIFIFFLGLDDFLITKNFLLFLLEWFELRFMLCALFKHKQGQLLFFLFLFFGVCFFFVWRWFFLFYWFNQWRRFLILLWIHGILFLSWMRRCLYLWFKYY